VRQSCNRKCLQKPAKPMESRTRYWLLAFLSNLPRRSERSATRTLVEHNWSN